MTSAAAAAAKEILDMAWAARADFVCRPEPLARSIARAKELGEGPILFVDHAEMGFEIATSGGTIGPGRCRARRWRGALAIG